MTLNKAKLNLVHYPFNDEELNSQYFEYNTISHEITTFQGYSKGNLYTFNSLRDSFNLGNLSLIDDILYPKPKNTPILSNSADNLKETYHGISWFSFTKKCGYICDYCSLYCRFSDT